MGPSNSAEMTRSLPSVFWVNEVSLETGANVGGGGGGGGATPGCRRAGGGSLVVIATTRGPLTRENDLPCRETETNRPVVLLISSDRPPAAAVSVSLDSVAAGLAPPADLSTWSN